MLKTLLHIIVAVVLWSGLQALGVGILWRIGAVVVGAVAVHLVWERVFLDPYLYLGAIPVSPDDPVMLKAREEAATTLPFFLRSLFPEHPKESMVKFRFGAAPGKEEYLWADLLEINGDRLKVFVRTPPIHHDQPIERTREVDLADVVDWQVEYPDGTIRGGYTNRALFTIFEREEGDLHPRLRTQFARFRELDEPGI